MSILLMTLARAAHVYGLACFGAELLIAGFVNLVERRGRGGESLHRGREIEISNLLESMSEAVFIFGEDAKLIDVNRAAERLTGLNLQQLKEVSGEELGHLLSSDEDARDTLVPVFRALSGEAAREERKSLRSPKDGRVLETIVSANAIRDEGGRIRGCLAIIRDITELTDLQRKLADTERHHAIGQMAAGLAHDFSNVLDTIGQATYVLEHLPERNPEERKRVLDMINTAVNRGAEIVSRVREYLRGSRGKAELLDLNICLEEAIELTRPLWQSGNVSISRQFRKVSRVCANAADLRRVFTNLVMNAMEAMPTGGTLTVGCEQKGDRVYGYVCDTGGGIPPEQQKNIFVPYFTTKKQGTGLGLSGAQKTISAHGGKIQFKSRPGLTQFFVEFPVTAECA